MSRPDLPNCGTGLRAAAFEAAPHGYLLLDLDFLIVDVNERYLELTRTSRDRIVGTGLFEAFPDNPNDSAADGVRNLRRSLEAVRKTGRPHAMAVQKYDIPVPGDDGEGFEERYWKPVNAPVIRDGKLVALLHHVEDVTSEILQKRDQAIRLRSAQKLQGLAFWEYDPRTETAYVSRAFSMMQGLPEREGTLSADECFAPIPADDLKTLRTAFKAAEKEADHTPVSFTHRVVQQDGSVRWLSSQGELARDHRDALPRFLLVSMDITPTKRREEKLAQAVDERDRLLAEKEMLLAEVNHRIKNSLQLVSSILNIDARRAGDEAAREQLKRAAARVGAVTSVHEMLYRSNEVASVEFGSYLRELCEMLAAGDVAAARARILCDPAQVRLSADKAIPLALLTNELVSNSLKYGLSETGESLVEVRTFLDGDELLLEVADNGPGKAVDAPPGLGTRIIEGLVEQLGATMTTKDRGPGYSVIIRTPHEEE